MDQKVIYSKRGWNARPALIYCRGRYLTLREIGMWEKIYQVGPASLPRTIQRIQPSTLLWEIHLWVEPPHPQRALWLHFSVCRPDSRNCGTELGNLNVMGVIVSCGDKDQVEALNWQWQGGPGYHNEWQSQIIKRNSLICVLGDWSWYP